MEASSTIRRTGDRILRLPEVANRTGLSGPTIYKRARKGTFPKPIKLGPNSTGWLESEIDGFLSNAVAERDQALSA